MSAEKKDCLTEYEKEKALISTITFSDRKLGFYERNEIVLLQIDYTEPRGADIAYHLVITDGYGQTVRDDTILAKKGESQSVFVLGHYPLGWYRIHLTLNGGTDALCEYMAFVVVVALPEREGLQRSVSADVAAEYEPKTMAFGDEFVRTLRLQGFDWIRSRTNMTAWDKQTTEYRERIREAGFKVTSTSTDDMRNMPHIKTMDLRNVYRKYKDAPGLNPITNEMYELQNESDLFFDAPALPDSLCAYSKAAFIGLSDSGCAPLLSMTSMAFSADAIYYDLMLQNGILDYSNIYNFHGYDGIESKAAFARKVALAYSPKDSIRPTFMTENGLKVWADTDGVVFFDQMIRMCQYAVRSSAKILSEGCDKWFWFIARAFLELGGGFGNMHAWTHQPYPIAAVLSNLTYQLGLGEYKGKLSDTGKDTYGYVFDRGNSDVIVLFSSTKGQVRIRAEKMTVVDMFGGEKEYVCDENGRITVEASADPVFLRMDGRLAETEYYRSRYKVMECERKEFTQAERVVLNAVWMDQDLMNSMIMQKGYLLTEKDRQSVSLRVYNFNDQTVSGHIVVTAEHADHFDITVEETGFTIQPWGRADIDVCIKATDKAIMNSSGDIKFSAILSSGEEVSAAVCRYWFRMDDMDIDNKDIVQFKDFTDEKNWNLHNIMEPGKIEMTADAKEQSVTIRVDYCGDYAQWFFPEYYVQNPEIFDGADGIVLRRRNSACAKTKLTAFVCTDDGRSYWSGDASGVPFDDEWKTIVYPWDTFILFSSPEGFNDPRPFDPKHICKVRVGASGTPTDGVPHTTIKDFGIFYDRINAPKPHAGDIVLTGIEEGHTYKTAEGLTMTALLPPDVVGDVRVMLGKSVCDHWTVDGNLVSADLSALGRGEYVLQVSGKTAMNYRYIKYVSFNIEGARVD